MIININMTQLISADVMDFDLDLEFEEIFDFVEIPVLVTFQFW